MDLTSLMGTLLSGDSVKGLSKATGSSQGDITSVLNAALPMLLQGISGQAQDKNSGFDKALEQHAQNDASDLGSFFGGIDLADGAKIIGHLLGSDTDSSTKSVAKKTGVSQKDAGNILAAAAPLLMSLLGQETKKSAGSGNDLLGEIIGAVLENVDLGDVLGALLGGSSKKTTKKAAADDGFGLDDAVDLLGKLLK